MKMLKKLRFPYLGGIIHLVIFAIWVRLFAKRLDEFAFGFLLCLFCSMLGLIGHQERTINKLRERGELNPTRQP